ncbi:hypothetical protein LCGC14_0378890 [marine sediment metagenome]|uniref:Uncharacterized protein n=1 Tax=marine sediment metagenome TaxID=412755 RepID=A0A0F9VQA4_9ZZZZ
MITRSDILSSTWMLGGPADATVTWKHTRVNRGRMWLAKRVFLALSPAFNQPYEPPISSSTWTYTVPQEE